MKNDYLQGEEQNILEKICTFGNFSKGLFVCMFLFLIYYLYDTNSWSSFLIPLAIIILLPIFSVCVFWIMGYLITWPFNMMKKFREKKFYE